MNNYNLEVFRRINDEIIDKSINRDEARRQLIEIIDDYIIQRSENNSEIYNLQANIEKFIKEKEQEGVRPNTLKSYKLQLSIFYNFIDKNVNLITKEDLREFFKFRKESSNSLQTIRSILKTFFDWLEDEKLIYINPITKIKPFRQCENYVEALNKDELDIVRQACVSSREQAMIEVFCSTGCTLSELVMLNIQNINFNSNEITIYNELRGNRTGFLFPDAINIIKNYLNERDDTCESLFISERKPYRRMQERGVQLQIKKIAERTNLKKVISPKTFRHTFAKTMLDNGCPMNTLQTLLGNKEYTSTSETYIRITSNNKKKIYDKYYKL